MNLNVSLFDNKHDALPRPATWTWGEFCARLEKPMIRANKDGALFSPATFEPAHRKKENVTEIAALTLDYDHGADLSRDTAPWRSLGLKFAVYTTHSHQRNTKEQPEAEDRFRVVIPLAEPIPAAQFAALWQWAAELSGGKIDPAPKDVSRMFYLPVKAAPDAPYHYEVQDGAALDWRALPLETETHNRPLAMLVQAAREERVDYDAYVQAALHDEVHRILTAANGSRNAQLNKSAFALGQLIGAGILTEADVIGALEPAAQSAGLNGREIAATIRSGINAGMKEPRELPESVRRIATRVNHMAATKDRPSTEQPVDEGATVQPAGQVTTSEPVSGITHNLFDGQLIFGLEPVERGKVKLTARNQDGLLHRDVLSLDKAEDRAKFIKKLGLDAEQEKTAHRALLELSDQAEKLPARVEAEPTKEERRVVHAVLPDGHLIEQIAGGQFAVYDPQTDDVTYRRSVETDCAIYKPLEDDFLAKGGLCLPERLVSYGNDAALDTEIETCIHRYSDVLEREQALSGKYVRLSYIADKLNEISYLRATGERGSGKSRYICTTGMLCLRPVLVTSPSAASLYRMMDAYAPTLIIDECNLAAHSEDTEAVMQILNSGFQRITSVPRIEKGADGQMTVRMFSPFGPKLIGGLKISDSPAFESRCIHVALKKTTRKDIPFRMTERMLSDFAALRAKLYLWRLRNMGRDYEQALDEAERELKQYEIEPRYIQIAIPLYGLLSNDDLKKDFVRLLEGRTDDAASEKRESLDGQLVSIIHKLLFETVAVGEGENAKEEARWRKDVLSSLSDDKPIEAATTERITAEFNTDLPDKQKHDSKWIGSQLGKLAFKRKEITSRKSTNRKKMALVFDRQTFAEIFKSYNLPVPVDFIPAIPATQINANTGKDLDWPVEEKADNSAVLRSGQPKALQNQQVLPLAGMAEIKETSLAGDDDVEVF